MVDADGNISDDDTVPEPAAPATPTCHSALPHIDAEEQELSANYDFSTGQDEGQDDDEEPPVQNQDSDGEEEQPNELEPDADNVSTEEGNGLETNGVCQFHLF